MTLSKLDIAIIVAAIIACTLAFAILTLPPIGLVIRGIDVHAWERLPESGVPEAVILSLGTTSLTALVILLLGIPSAYRIGTLAIPVQINH